jgi:hypothetical protein
MTKMNGLTILIAIVVVALNFAFLAEETENPRSEEIDETELADERIYQLRTYTTHPGKLDDLHERFANHTVRLFARHGMVNVGYWVPVDRENTLIYVLSHNSRQAAEKSWQAFLDDPEWQEAFEESRTDGPIVSDIESVFMKATPYSQIR